MTEQSERSGPGGTLIRGADGSLYFVPDEALETFRLPEDKAARTQQVLDREGEAKGISYASPGVYPLEGGPALATGVMISDADTATVASLGSYR